MSLQPFLLLSQRLHPRAVVSIDTSAVLGVLVSGVAAFVRDEASAVAVADGSSSLEEGEGGDVGDEDNDGYEWNEKKDKKKKKKKGKKKRKRKRGGKRLGELTVLYSDGALAAIPLRAALCLRSAKARGRRRDGEERRRRRGGGEEEEEEEEDLEEFSSSLPFSSLAVPHAKWRLCGQRGISHGASLSPLLLLSSSPSLLLFVFLFLPSSRLPDCSSLIPPLPAPATAVTSSAPPPSRCVALFESAPRPHRRFQVLAFGRRPFANSFAVPLGTQVSACVRACVRACVHSG